MKKEKRYYQIRIDYFWLSILAVIIVISIIIAYYASAHEQTSSQPVSTKHRADIDVTLTICAHPWKTHQNVIYAEMRKKA